MEPEHRALPVLNQYNHNADTRLALPVLNQYNRGADTRLACVPISVMAVYFQYEALCARRELSPQQWDSVMERGVNLWRVWRAKEPQRLPTVSDVLALPECAPFVRVFGAEPREFAGLVCDAHGIDQPEGSLEAMLREMFRLCTDEARTVCCLLVLPNIICCSVICVPPRHKGDACDARFFDSHDTRTRYCDYALFGDYQALLRYILRKYPARGWTPSEQAGIERTQALYGYSAMLFIK